jgi:carbohydrate-selective porin OprB
MNAFGGHMGGGVVWRAPLPQQAHDALGFGLTHVDLTHEPAAGLDEGEETTLERFYKIRIGHFFSLAPDLQYVHHADGVSFHPDALVFTPRVALTF